MSDFLFRGNLSDIDPEVFELTQIEAERQYRKLILIPSESTAPMAVRDALGSAFQNLYAEGYPDEDTRWMREADILDYPARLATFRRYSDPRYYKGTEYANVIEALARRRCAETFATAKVSADQLFVNVQPLSGAPANNAVYTALLNPGDTIMGMNLLHGGHLSHGSSVNRSGKLFNVVHYNVDPKTEQIDYDAVKVLALEHKPKIIIAGYSSYPWVPDWARFRQIADEIGAILLADMSHIAGLVAGKAIDSPVGKAQIITFTTHKTLAGPRSACIITQDAALARKLDRAVFPGEQGGPHMHAIAGLAVTFKLAQTEAFSQMQHQIIKNCQALTARLGERGLRIVFGGTNTHLGNLDCKSVTGPDGTPLSGDMAARILDLAGIVANRNTIPGDRTALQAMGIRYGTPWITQRGLREPEMVKLADIMADLLFATHPYAVEGRRGDALRAKVDFTALQDAKMRVRDLAESAGIDFTPAKHGYPHFYYLDDQPSGRGPQAGFDLSGDKIRQYLNFVLSSDVEALQPGDRQNTRLYTPQGPVDGVLTCVSASTWQLSVSAEHAGLAAAWLRDLSDGFVAFPSRDGSTADHDLTRRIPGPVLVQQSNAQPAAGAAGDPEFTQKPYYIGMDGAQEGQPLPAFQWTESESEQLLRTSLYETHVRLGAKMVPFAGWEMPVWYTSVVEEHNATRKAAGLFDVTHMGVYQAEGPDAAAFLDSVCANDISGLGVGESAYTHLLDPDANVIDDLLVYRRAEERYLIVVNASNDDKDWAWLNAVRDGTVCVDKGRPWSRAYGRNAVLRNLRDPKEGDDCRVDVALQGPRARDILLSLEMDQDTRRRILALKRTELCEARVNGIDLVVSRTGYTGEKMAFELFVHPQQAPTLWDALLLAGDKYGLKPCGLGARDSLRTEAGLPLYGHEMAGQLGLGVAEAGFGNYVKTYKPWFIGREAYLRKEQSRNGVVARFRFSEKNVRMAHLGDPVLNLKGRVIGTVTSCAVDSEGFLTGQAFIDAKQAVEGTPVLIFQGSPGQVGKTPAQLETGDRFTLPGPALVLSRFPKLG
jgi:glycine hydroxymethyltransferase